MGILESDLPNNIIDSAAIYRFLKTLEKNGFVKSRLDASESGVAKKYYSITESGHEELQKFESDIKKELKI